jgi:putative citrate transport
MANRRRSSGLLGAALLGLLAVPSLAPTAGHEPLQLPAWSVVPFVLLLLCIAVLPLAAGHFWHWPSPRWRRGRTSSTCWPRTACRAWTARRCCGAVVMGALSDIGNGPNFMVRAIAERAGYRPPSFFGYTLYAGLVLVPVYVLVTLLFYWPR